MNNLSTNQRHHWEHLYSPLRNDWRVTKHTQYIKSHPCISIQNITLSPPLSVWRHGEKHCSSFGLSVRASRLYTHALPLTQRLLYSLLSAHAAPRLLAASVLLSLKWDTMHPLLSMSFSSLHVCSRFPLSIRPVSLQSRGPQQALCLPWGLWRRDKILCWVRGQLWDADLQETSALCVTPFDPSQSLTGAHISTSCLVCLISGNPLCKSTCISFWCVCERVDGG